MLRHAVLAGLLGAGCEVHDLGVAPTPTVGLAVRRLEAAGGIQITASHNPAQWNGLKLFGPDGRVLSAAEGSKVKALFEAGALRRVAVGRARQRPTDCRQAEDWHRDRVLRTGRRARASAPRGFAAFLDANGGAGGPLGQRLLEALQARAGLRTAATPTASSRHEPEPTAENLQRRLPAGRRARAPTSASSSTPTPTGWP